MAQPVIQRKNYAIKWKPVDFTKSPNVLLANGRKVFLDKTKLGKKYLSLLNKHLKDELKKTRTVAATTNKPVFIFLLGKSFWQPTAKRNVFKFTVQLLRKPKAGIPGNPNVKDPPKSVQIPPPL